MKNKFLLIAISTLFFCLNFSVEAQNYTDLARTFSQRETGGTARMQGMGGISSALGGDITSTISNPAGLGFFNRSEFSLSPSLGFHNTDSKYLGRSTADYKTNFNFGTLGVVLNNTKRNPTNAWRGGSFGISMTRINDFHNKVNYRGSNPENDFISYAINEAQTFLEIEGQNADPEVYLPDLSYLAYKTTLIGLYESEENPEILEFGSDVDPPTADYPVSQSELITTKGAGYTTNFSYGGNFSDKFYIGAGIGFTSISYEIERVYTESPSETILNNLVLSEYREIEGSGFNISVGTIYRPMSTLTIGLSYTSPTFYNLEDASRITLTSEFNVEDAEGEYTYSESVDYLPFEFDYRTPGRVNGGIAYFIGKNGFITADVEYLDYTSNKYSSNDYDFSGENDDINRVLNSVINYKVGGEYRFNIFRARAGYAFFADPTNSSDVDRSRHSFSIGGGIRLPNYYIDLAVINTRYESAYIPYGGASTAMADNNFTRGILTVGFNF